MNKHFYSVNSRDRSDVKNTTSSRFSYEVKYLRGAATHAVVSEVVIPKTYWLVPNDDTQNFFYLTELGVETKVTMAKGNYSAGSFLIYMATLLNASSPNGYTYAITRPNARTGPDTGMFTYTVTGNGADQPALGFTTELHRLFGFASNSTNTFEADTLVSTHVVNFNRYDAIFIASDMCASADGRSVLQTVFSTGVVDGGSITYSAQSTGLGGRPLRMLSGGSFSFSLIDTRGQLVDLNGSNWSMSLLLYIDPVSDAAETKES